MPTQDLAELTEAMDALNMQVDGESKRSRISTDHSTDGTTSYDSHGPEFLDNAVRNASETPQDGWLSSPTSPSTASEVQVGPRRQFEPSRVDVSHGARGLKIYKSLGLSVVDQEGQRVRVDDERLAPVWDKCGELGVPVLIHTENQLLFGYPEDGTNERLLELMEKPDRYRGPDHSPTWEEIMAEQHAVFRRHPSTTFISAHLGWMGNDLGRLGALLDELPNVYTEIGAVLAELGRQPRNAQRFFIEYQDRVLFGKDSWTPSEYAYYFRVLETDDEYFDYYRRRHGLWEDLRPRSTG